MRALPVSARWAVLLSLSAVLFWVCQLMHLPAAGMLGAMAAGIVVASNGGSLTVPGWLLLPAQTLIGCLMARGITPQVLGTMAAHWPLFLATTILVIAASTGLGLALARFKVLPGTTAIWGSAPGGSLPMILMAEAYGADSRLVAFMQFLRMVLVGVAASVIARLWVAGPVVAPTQAWFAPVALTPLAATITLALICGLISLRVRFPGGPFLLTLLIAAALSASGLMTISVPPLLVLVCSIAVGWMIGLKFTADIVRHAARMGPRVLVSIVALLALCGGLGYGLHLVTGADMLSAYFATSPGGADSVAIIAASSPSAVDLPFVMTMQMTRLLTMMAAGPWIARASARWSERGTESAEVSPAAQ